MVPCEPRDVRALAQVLLWVVAGRTRPDIEVEGRSFFNLIDPEPLLARDRVERVRAARLAIDGWVAELVDARENIELGQSSVECRTTRDELEEVGGSRVPGRSKWMQVEASLLD